MKRELVLNGERFHLLFSIDSNAWTTVTLQHDGSEEIRLGCESLKHIVASLLDFLLMRRAYEYTSTYQETKCRTVVVLSEPHGILFAHHQNDLHQFFVVERFGNRVGDFTLDDHRAAIWEETLRRWLQR